ncbi:ASKHA domain-containing protein [Desulfosporosinus metallidurans]|uniref:Putative electron transfer protein n=1 Tax=Desulfosporosinus metallidurans TaxID=1888891 RepID=A0A1Q8QFL3_9FIRM|nr:ASKHA domain-containing protein [Desulfosporosinus metallidurans]OLN26143.1 putative electron transfer protein [Desulfosporosinus metallidurans]
MKITILPNRVIMTMENESLMEALIRHQLPVQNVCNGEGTCGKCKVRITRHVSPPNDRDLEHLNDTELKSGVRLACAVKPEEGMVIELNFVASQDRKESVLLGLKATTLDPGIEKVFVKSSIPSLADERGDWDRFVDELSIVTGKNYPKASIHTLSKVPYVLREGDFALTATVYGNEILDIEAGDTTKRFYGVAIDIGTTSVAVALVDLNRGDILKVLSAENEQTAYGADVISRITYARESQEKALTLRASIRRTINHLLEELAAQTNVTKNEIYKMTIVGNTTMHHLFIGLEITHLAVSPFVSVCNRPLEFTADELGMDINSQARINFLPNIGSFVGADTAGAIMGASEILEPGNHLLIDLGTNCELFLKTDDTMIACSTAAGPAFEGAGIVHGMRAKIGAIESVTLTEEGTVSCQVIGDQEPIGICGSGLIEGIDEMRKVGVVNKQGKIVDPEKVQGLSPELSRRIRMGENGREFVLTYGANQGFDVTLNQKDIGELQLAKGAVCAGIKTLVEIAKISLAELDSVTLSGTFATYLKANNILNIGLVPDIAPEKIKTVGNAAHVGALLALIDHNELAKAGELYRKISHVELGGSPKFSNYFMTSMYLERNS